MRWLLILVMLGFSRVAHADRSPIKCDNQSTADVDVDGLLEEWPTQVLERGVVYTVKGAELQRRDLPKKGRR